MYKTIYVGEKPVILIEESDPLLPTYAHDPNVLLLNELSAQISHTIMHETQDSTIEKIVLTHSSLETLEHFFFKHFNLIQAAGGIIENENNELLIIFRRGKWDLPKGKIDLNETPEICALREVEEETGLKNISLGALICMTYHVYEAFGKKMLKETYWYKMNVVGLQQLQPQTEEDIESAIWIPKCDWPKYAPDSYASIRQVMDAF